MNLASGRVFGEILRMKSLCVFCGSSSGKGTRYLDAARMVGRRLAEERIELVYGGGSVGLMGAVADACLEAGGKVVGVITRQLLDLEVGHQGCTELIVIDSMLERKNVMLERSDAFLSLPGGIGTLDELFEMLCGSQLDLHRKPSALLDVDGYFEVLAVQLAKMVEEGFVQQEHVAMLFVSPEFEELLTRLGDYQPTAVAKWVRG